MITFHYATASPGGGLLIGLSLLADLTRKLNYIFFNYDRTYDSWHSGRIALRVEFLVEIGYRN